jgi:hypothetical protein
MNSRFDDLHESVTDSVKLPVQKVKYIDAAYTVTSTDFGKTLIVSGAVTVTLAANASSAGAWIRIISIADSTVTISPATATTLISKNTAVGTSITFETGSNKIGACAMCLCTGSAWVVMNNSDCTMTVNT